MPVGWVPPGVSGPSSGVFRSCGVRYMCLVTQRAAGPHTRFAKVRGLLRPCLQHDGAASFAPAAGTPMNPVLIMYGSSDIPRKANAHRSERADNDLRATSGKSVCAWPSKTLLRYVREHDICESSNRGLACLTRNPSFRAHYAVCFVVIVVGDCFLRMCVWRANALLRECNSSTRRNGEPPASTQVLNFQ